MAVKIYINSKRFINTFVNIIFLFVKKPQLIFKAINIMKKGGLNSLISSFMQTTKVASQQYKSLGQFQESIKLLNTESILVFNHSLGGGADKYICERIKRDFSERFNVFIIQYIPAMNIYSLQFYNNESICFKFNLIEDLFSILKFLNLRKIVINELVAYDNLSNVLDSISIIKKKTKAEIEIVIHDYFVICPNYNLLNNQNKFCEICINPVNSSCLKKNKYLRKEYKKIKIADWRKRWEEFLQLVDVIICFSKTSKDFLLKVYPTLDNKKIVLKPHTLDYIRKVFVKEQSGMINIGVIGNITEIKGASIINEMAEIIHKKKYSINIIVIGKIHGTINKKVIKVKGEYSIDSLVDIVEDAMIDIVFIPSICPETFSYTTEEAMMMGLPVAVFNIGAPAERVSKYIKGLVIDEIDPVYAVNKILGYFNRSYDHRD